MSIIRNVITLITSWWTFFSLSSWRCRYLLYYLYILQISCTIDNCAFYINLYLLSKRSLNSMSLQWVCLSVCNNSWTASPILMKFKYMSGIIAKLVEEFGSNSEVGGVQNSSFRNLEIHFHYLSRSLQIWNFKLDTYV